MIIPLVVLVGLVLSGAGALAAAADPSPAAEDDFTERIAGERMNAGLAGYEVAPDLVDVARRHAEEMARQDRLFHNPRLASDVKDWDSVGENVGTGETVADIHRAFMESSTHRAEILSRKFTQVGVGVVERDGVIWVAQVFRKPSAPAPAAPPPTTAAPRAPASTTTTPTTIRPPEVTAPVTTTSAESTTTSSPSPVTEPTLPSALEVVDSDRSSAVAGSSRRRRQTATVREVTSPMAAASALLVLVVGALAAQVAAESRRTAGPT